MGKGVRARGTIADVDRMGSVTSGLFKALMLASPYPASSEEHKHAKRKTISWCKITRGVRGTDLSLINVSKLAASLE
jgi:hypothetical protein